jgi:tetratricopeptide (TPR) repeat protein
MLDAPSAVTKNGGNKLCPYCPNSLTATIPTFPVEKHYLPMSAIQGHSSLRELMSTRKEIEALLSYVLDERNRLILESSGLNAVPKDKRIAALRGLQDLGWVGHSGLEDFEESYSLTKDGNRVFDQRPDISSLQPIVRSQIECMRDSLCNDQDLRRSALRKLVDIECELSNWDSALLYCFELRTAAEKAKDTGSLAFTHFAQGRVERAQNHWHEALESYLKALELYMESGDRRGVCDANRQMGIVYGSIGDLASAVRCLESSLSLARDIGDREAVTKAEANLAVVYDLEGRFEESKRASNDCLAYFLETGDLSSAVKTANNLGVLNMSRERFDAAAEYFEKAISSSKSLMNRTVMGAAMVNAGYCYARAGEVARSLDYTEKAVQVFKEPNDTNMLALAYRNYGYIEFRKGSLEQGFEWFEKSVRAAKVSGVRDTMAACCYEYGMCLIKSTLNPRLAKKLLVRASSIYGDIGNAKRSREIDGVLTKVALA